jgi:SulP family sulfate permease
VLIGVALSTVLYVAQQSNKVVLKEWVLVPDGFPVEQSAPETLPSHRLTLLQVYGSLFFAAAKNLEEMLPVADNTTRAVVVLSLRGRAEIGSTFVGVLRRYAKTLHAGNSKLMLVGVDTAVLAQLAKTGVLDLIGEENVFIATPQLGAGLNQAVTAAHAWLATVPETPGLGK